MKHKGPFRTQKRVKIKGHEWLIWKMYRKSLASTCIKNGRVKGTHNNQILRTQKR